MKAAGGAVGEAGRQRLHQVYAAKTPIPDLRGVCRLAALERTASRAHCACFATRGLCRLGRLPPMPRGRISQLAGAPAWRKCSVPIRPGDVMGRFSGEEILGGSARAVAEDGQRFIELRDAESGKWTRYRVDALIGSKWQQAYASKLPDGRLVVMPIQYSKVEGGWVDYWKIADGSSERSDIGHFNGTPDGALYQRDCAPCHTSQLRYSGAGASPATAQFREGGINCEMCHGPSQAHVDAMSGGSARRAASAFRRRAAGGFPQNFRRAVGRHLRAVPHAIAGLRAGGRRSSELFAGRRSLLSHLQPPSAFGLLPQDLLRRRPLPRDDFHRRSLRTIALLPRRRSHLRVVPQSPPGRSGRESEIPQIRARFR